MAVERPVSQRGFTLLETAAVCVIAALILLSTLPGYFQFRSTQRRAQARSQVLRDLNGARQSAVTRRAPVIVAFGNGVVTTDITSYTIHVDANGDGAFQAGEQRTTRTLPPETRLFRVLLAPTDSVIFDISGVLRPGTTGGSLVVVSRSVPETLLVSGSGMVYQL